MFNSLKFGFRSAPTDYYLKPYWLALYNSSSSAPNKLNTNSNPCYYEDFYHNLSFNWLRAFHDEYSIKTNNTTKVNQNHFGLLKVNELSHDYLEHLFWVDNDLENLFKDLLSDSFLENTLVIFMGDHGHRFHKIRQTFTGKAEEKLPLFSMLVPKRLLNKNRYLKNVLARNTQSKYTNKILSKFKHNII